ncbi:unnamed protein product [Calypogeia fissa]
MATAERGNSEQGETIKLMEEFLIAEYILNGEKAPANTPDLPIPSCPVLVFVNCKSGGQMGTRMIPHLHALLHPKQVIELPKEKPEEKLAELLRHLKILEEGGDTLATEIKARLRLIVAGGDGTHGWLLGVVADLRLKELPPVSTIPLGTGNNLPYSFGWGKKNPPTSVSAMREILLKTADAKPMPVDRWRVIIRMSKTVEDSPLKMVPSNINKVHNLTQLQSFQRVSDNHESFEARRHSYQGGFWNYLSIGMDSQVSYAFHTARKEHPEKFKNQFMNQTRYASLACTQGWFCASCLHPRSRNINTLANIFIAKYDQEWHKLEISSSIRSIIMLNLPSFSGGLNPWGKPGISLSEERRLTAPYINDGLIEIVGFRDGWHGLALFLPPHHGTRLAQANKVKIEFHEGGVDHTFMRVDGEPWLQNLPPDDRPTVMEIVHQGQAVALAIGECVAKQLPTEVAEKGKLPISTASFNSVLETGSSQNSSLKQSKYDEVEGRVFLEDEASSHGTSLARVDEDAAKAMQRRHNSF